MRNQYISGRREEEGTYEVDDTVEVFQAFFLEHSGIHVVLEVSVIHLIRSVRHDK